MAKKTAPAPPVEAILDVAPVEATAEVAPEETPEDASPKPFDKDPKTGKPFMVAKDGNPIVPAALVERVTTFG